MGILELIKVANNIQPFIDQKPPTKLNLGLALVLVVVCHLQAGATEPALDVEALVGFAAVKNALVAADLGRHVVEGLDDAQAELLALLVLCDGDVFDVADEAEVVDAGLYLLAFCFSFCSTSFFLLPRFARFLFVPRFVRLLFFFLARLLFCSSLCSTFFLLPRSPS